MPKFIEGFAEKLSVPAGARDTQVFDDALPGFGIRKFANGRPTKKHPQGKPGPVSYFVKFNVGKQQRRKTLGRVVRGNLAQMRKLASEILAKARLGTDVVAEQRAAIAKSTVPTLRQLVPLYLAAREAGEDEHGEVKPLKPRSMEEVTRYLERSWKPLKELPIDTVTRSHINDTLNDLVRLSGKVAADRARMALSGLYGWAIERGYCDANPTMHITSRAKNGARTRVLSEPELAEVWRACLDDDHGRIVRLLILTGQRRTEIGDLAWSEVDFEKRQVGLPEHRTKNGRPHIVPLSAEAVAILKSATKTDGRDFVFGIGAGGFSGWSKAKAELDARIAAGRKKAGTKLMPAWVLHDLRRSFVTHISERGFAQPHVIEALVNHVSGAKANVAGIYNRASYLAEKRQALELWSAHMGALVTRSTKLFRERAREARNEGPTGRRRSSPVFQ